MRLKSPSAVDLVLPRRSVRAAYLMMLLSSLSFAAMTSCARAAGQGCSDWRIPAVARGLIVFLFALAIARLRGVPLVWRGSKVLWMRSLTGSFSMLLTFFALTHHDNISTAVTLTNTFPLWVTLLAWPVLGERPTLATGIALFCGILGVGLIEPPDSDIRWSSVTALGAAFCTAVVMLGLHRLKHLNALSIVVHFSAVATVTGVGFILVTAILGQTIDATPLLRPANVALLIGIGVFATAGQILMTQAFRTAQPQRLAVVGLTQVVFTLLFDWLLWSHVVHGWALVGILLVVMPVGWLLVKRRS